MGRFVIVAYRPKPGRAQQLDALVARHFGILAGEGLVTDRPACVMRSADGTLVEVFEWRSPDAIEQAHANEAVRALWAQFDEVCDYLPLQELPESDQMFAEFDSVPA
jgi:hypothetical protein